MLNMAAIGSIPVQEILIDGKEYEISVVARLKNN
jgi:hypothetical protein